MPEVIDVPSEDKMKSLGGELLKRLKPGDLVMLEGELGAGKTTLVRGMAESAGWTEPLRSPTFNLMQEVPVDPPLMHADLYRVKSAWGIGLEDYLESHICLVEWPDRLAGFYEADEAWIVHIEFDSETGRKVTIQPPV